jgi:hypothetical protein
MTNESLRCRCKKCHQMCMDSKVNENDDEENILSFCLQCTLAKHTVFFFIFTIHPPPPNKIYCSGQTFFWMQTCQNTFQTRGISFNVICFWTSQAVSDGEKKIVEYESINSYFFPTSHKFRYQQEKQKKKKFLFLFILFEKKEKCVRE